MTGSLLRFASGPEASGITERNDAPAQGSGSAFSDLFSRVAQFGDGEASEPAAALAPAATGKLPPQTGKSGKILPVGLAGPAKEAPASEETDEIFATSAEQAALAILSPLALPVPVAGANAKIDGAATEAVTDATTQGSSMPRLAQLRADAQPNASLAMTGEAKALAAGKAGAAGAGAPGATAQTPAVSLTVAAMPVQDKSAQQPLSGQAIQQAQSAEAAAIAALQPVRHAAARTAKGTSASAAALSAASVVAAPAGNSRTMSALQGRTEERTVPATLADCGASLLGGALAGSTASANPAMQAPAPAAAAPAPLDFGQVIDRLSAAREALEPTAAALSIDHAEFGEISLRFDQRADGGLSVELAASNPDAHRAVTAAVAAERSQSAGQDSQNQAQAQTSSGGNATTADRDARGGAASQRQDQAEPRQQQARRHDGQSADQSAPRDGIFA